MFFCRRTRRFPRSLFPLGIAASVVFCSTVAYLHKATAKDGASDPADSTWQAGAVAYAKRMGQMYSDPKSGQQPTPPVIPKFSSDADPSGAIATLQPGGPTETSQNAFFANLGTINNGRTCFSCHQPQTGWTVSAASVQRRFEISKGDDPIFRVIDGATCPSADVSSMVAKRKAYHLLLEKGLIRIGLPVPANAEFRITAVKDPYNCNTNPATGLTHIGPDGPTTGIVSVYRRPLPSTNLGFLTAIMWDGREPSLASQAIDATRIHAQATKDPTDAQQKQIVAFESGIFTAQIFDNDAKLLDAGGAKGGPYKIAQLLPGFYVGINDPLGGNPKGLPFTSKIFDLYDAWGGSYASWVSTSRDEDVKEARRAVARGQALFNNTPINITRVAGINDALGVASVSGFCGTCHDTPDIGNHSVKLPINIGIANGGSNNDNPDLDIVDLPVFSVLCPSTGQTYTVTDLGRAMISGKCADVGKVKGPILRGLAGRAPYFHNGSAATLLDVVNFYDDRFNIGFTDQQKRDLVAFLESL